MKIEIDKISIEDKEYPALLKEIANPPQNLYYSGDISLLKTRCVAVVGTRKPTDYGLWAAESLSRRLASSNLTVVSGFALGVDTMAHKGALMEGGKTIAVLGCGIDLPYPASNMKLKEELLKTGLLISEYPPGYPGSKYTFPMRNRIISGLCEAIVVGEAGIGSGAAITAELGIEQSRKVYAIPGNINSVTSMGSNKLIEDGAMPLITLGQVLEDLEVGIKWDLEKSRGNLNLGLDEKSLSYILEDLGEITFPQGAKLMNMTIGNFTGLVTVLEIKGLVYTSLGKIFLAK